ncbi:MAG: hypothetical protein KGH72_05980, partial [Candidatus Micrarchaeota archaeon]|nr:hypothetical protein [Candidatus Micrarchaeota archaeon]
IADLVELREYGEKACAIRLKGLGAKAMIAVGGVLSGAGALFTVLGTDYMLKGSSAAASSGIAMNPHSGYAFTALIGSLSIAMGAPLACKVNSLLKATGKALTEYKEPLRRLKEWDKASRSLHDEAHRLNKQAMRTIEMALHKETDWDKVAELDYKIDMVNDQIAERAIIAAEASKRL